MTTATSEPSATLDGDVCYRALSTRDARFDGRFYTAVVSTGIFCRPICPARTPRRENCIFLPSAGAAMQLGYRPCLRCRPEVAPDVAAWRGSANTVSRALTLIAEGSFDEDGADGLAERLGVGSRHLRRLFDRHLGASPVAVAQAHRLLFAKRLVTDTELSMTEIALASGYGSIRRFNDAFQHAYAKAPSALRRKRAARDSGSGLVLALPYTPPYDWDAILAFLTARATPGVEHVNGRTYTRSFSLDEATGWFAATPARDRAQLVTTIHVSDVTKLGAVVARIRRLFDLDADIRAIDAHLARDRNFTRHIATRPGVRVPGAWDAFELAVRAVLGQQISVRAATTIAGRLVARCGTSLPDGSGSVDRLFPTPHALATRDLDGLGLTKARAATLHELARAVVAEPQRLAAKDTLDDTVASLCALPGIGAWTAHYINMRALREPDAFPAADLVLRRAFAVKGAVPSAKALETRAEVWRPWRAYAAMRAWMMA